MYNILSKYLIYLIVEKLLIEKFTLRRTYFFFNVSSSFEQKFFPDKETSHPINSILDQQFGTREIRVVPMNKMMKSIEVENILFHIVIA